MFKKFFDHKAKNITLAAFILGFFSLLSAALGFFRDRLLSGRFGAGNELDIYYTAFRIPDFISMILIMGAISAAIVPIFNEYLVRSQKEAWQFLSNLFNVFLFSLIIICLVLVIFTPQILYLVAPGFSGEKMHFAVLLTRIMFLSPILLGISNIISSILQVFQRFLITSLSPLFYNLGIIFGIIFFVPKIGIAGLAWGVVSGALAHLLIQIPILLGIGFRPLKILNFGHPGILKIIKLTIPRSIGLAATQINLIVITAIASTLAAGSIAIFNLAESLSRPLLTFIGIAFSTAAFPSLSLAFSEKNKEKFTQIFFTILSRIIFLIVPLSILLFIFRDVFVKIILKAGKFSGFDVSLTAACLGLFALGLFAQGLILFIARAFYALQNTKIPAITSVMGMVINIVLSFLFVWLLSFQNYFQQFLIDFLNIQNLNNIKIVGLPLALSLSAIFQFVLLFILFKREIKKFS